MMTPEDPSEVLTGSMRLLLPEYPVDCFDSCVCDPPYELNFMGASWDRSGIAFQVETWREVYRALKPGAFLLAFGGSRTFHRVAVAIEDAGFEIRDTIMYLYGSGFPKSQNIAKAVDKADGTPGKVIGTAQGAAKHSGRSLSGGDLESEYEVREPGSELSAKWDGWGTALKPAHEPIIVARKPLIGTVVANIKQYGTGGMNIDACRVATEETVGGSGRWPANVLTDGSEEVAEAFAVFGERKSGTEREERGTGGMWSGKSNLPCGPQYGDSGSAMRFFYAAKASKEERDEGTSNGNDHPTVKPVSLMRWLVRLVNRPGARLLDPFFGSGSTGVAAEWEGVRYTGIELRPDAAEVARERTADARIKAAAFAAAAAEAARLAALQTVLDF